jgi:hypothetical protein
MIRLCESDLLKRDDLIKSCKYNSKEISVIFGSAPCTITDRALKLGVKLPECDRGYRNRKTKYQANKTFFKIWTAEMAYVVGFIAADGCILEDTKYRTCKYLDITLNNRDYNLLNNIKDMMESTHPIHIRPCGDSKKCSLMIHCTDLCDDLIRLGITPRKSLTLRWIEQCPCYLIPHLVRGYLDGDGCISITHDKRDRIRVFILGTKEFLTGISEYFNIRCSIKKPQGTNYHKLTYNDSFAKKFLDVIYENSTEKTRLHRKYQKYKEWSDNASSDYRPTL